MLHGKRPHSSTWYRWWHDGVKGVKLETVKLGGQRYTTLAAVRRFIALTNENSAEESDSLPSRRGREHEIARAERELRQPIRRTKPRNSRNGGRGFQNPGRLDQNANRRRT